MKHDVIQELGWGRLVFGQTFAEIEEIGRVAAFLASDAAIPLTGSVSYADRGFHIVA